MSSRSPAAASGTATPVRKGPEPVDAAALRRLRSIEGQISGIRRMVEDQRYCIDILTQISAVRAALNALGLEVLHRHLDHCVTDAIRQGDAAESRAVIDELTHVLARASI